MLMNTTSVMLSVFVLNLHHRHDDKPVPEWVRTVIFNGLARILCMQTKKHQSAASKQDRNSLAHKRFSYSSHRDSTRKRSRDILDGFSVSFAAKQLSGQLGSGSRPSPGHNKYKSQYSSPARHQHNNTSCNNSNNTGMYADQNSYNMDNAKSEDRQLLGGGDNNSASADYGAGAHAENLLRDLETQQFHLDEWKELARIMDRLFFWFTLFALLGFCASVFVISWARSLSK